jgi:S-adenosylmethionine:tRNA ribosyltransferase-isomerase
MSVVARARPTIDFELPEGRSAVAPPEARGIERDLVRLLVASADGVGDRHFRDLPHVLAPGDLLVLNTSATLPAAVLATDADGNEVPVHVSMALDDRRWVIELRRRDGAGPLRGGRPNDELALPGGVTVRLDQPYPDSTEAAPRLWTACPEPALSPSDYLPAHGHPIEYRYLAGAFPLADHQTVYADVPGSAEMPSAGRPFTERLLVRLMARGVAVAPIVLHAGVSSPELHEPPQPERYVVPAPTAALVTMTRENGGRVLAVGTTAVRALETVADSAAGARAGSGWTRLVLGPDRPARIVDGLITGLHPPEASHLDLLVAVAGKRLVQRAYDHALADEYLWHEFGDSMLLLPTRR